MQSLVEVVTATANTGATTQDVTISSFGTVVGLFGNLSLATVDGTAVNNGVISTGIWDGTNTRGKSFYSENAQSGTDTYQIKRNDRFFVVLDGTGAVTAYATISAITNGVRVSWFNSAGTATAPPTAWIMNFEFYGGSGAQAKIVDIAATTIATTTTSVGFQADALIGIGPGAFGTSASAAPSEMHLWFATRAPSIKNAGMVWNDQDNLATSAPTLWASETNCLVEPSGDVGRITAFSSTGFTLTNQAQNNPLPATSVLALKLPGISLWCGAISSPTATGVTTHTEPGIKMQAALLACTGLSALDTTATDDTASAFGVNMIGGRTGTPTERFAIARERDAQTTTSAASLAAAKVVRMVTGSGTSIYTGNWDTAWPDVGISINWTSANATARKIIMLAFGAETIQPSGIASTEAFGTPTIAATITVSPSGIASAEAFGSATLLRTITVSPSGIASAEAFGTPTIQPGAVTLSPSGIASAEEFGNPTIAATIVVLPSGIASAEAFGAPALSTSITVDLSGQGIASVEAFGNPTIAATIAVDLSGQGIASAEAFGTPDVLVGAVTIDLDGQGIASEEVFGTPDLSTSITVDLDGQGIASAEAFGTPSVTFATVVDLDGQGIASAEAFGTPDVLVGAVTIDLDGQGIASAEVFGVPSVVIVGAQVVDLDGQGIGSAEAFGTPLLIGTGLQLIQPHGIASAEAFGYPFIRGGFIAVTLKKKVHDALCLAAQLGTFIEATYDADACELVQGLQVQPASVEVNELTAAYQTLHRLGRKYVLDPTSWQWLLILKFNEEVICEPFVRALLEDPICIPRDENEDRQVTVKLVDTQYEHPPREGASNGTHARFRFQAELSPR